MSDTGWLDAESVWALYSQGSYWIDRTGQKHRIRDINDQYLGNLEQFVLKQGPSHCSAAAWSIPTPHMNGDMAQENAERAVMQMVDNLVDWSHHIRKSPLYRAIRQELRRRTKDPK